MASYSVSFRWKPSAVCILLLGANSETSFTPYLVEAFRGPSVGRRKRLWRHIWSVPNHEEDIGSPDYDSFSTERNEVEEMGGDAFFLEPDDEEDGFDIQEIESMGGDIGFLADNDVVDKSKIRSGINPSNVECMGSSGDLAEEPQAFGPTPDELVKMLKGLESMPSLDETSFLDSRNLATQIEEAGGDPFFLSDYEEEPRTDSLVDQDGLSLGGDPEFLLQDETSRLTRLDGDDGMTKSHAELAGVSNPLAVLSQVATTFSSVESSDRNPRGSVKENPPQFKEGHDDEGWEWDGTIDEEAHLGLD